MCAALLMAPVYTLTVGVCVFCYVWLEVINTIVLCLVHINFQYLLSHRLQMLIVHYMPKSMGDMVIPMCFFPKLFS